ncbi:spore coat protein [Clostridium thailandense]|uniref:spore coat protein n=1 Tax=Clostridium thailandense TaxID=2794346 RepID=UPI003988FDB2
MSWIDNACKNIMTNNKNNDNNSNNSNKSNNNNSENRKNYDKEIALELLTISKSDILSLATVITETTNPQLRELLKLQLTNSLNEHYSLSDIAVNKQWYNAFTNPEQQLKQDTNELQSLF